MTWVRLTGSMGTIRSRLATTGRFLPAVAGLMFLAAGLTSSLQAQPRLIADRPPSYQVGEALDPGTRVLDRDLKPVRLVDLIEPETRVAVLILFGGASAQVPEPPFRGGLWCEDSFDDVPIQRALVRFFEGQPVQFIPVAVPPVYNPTRHGYAEDVFLGKPDESREYLEAVRVFIEATEREAATGVLPFSRIYYDPKFRLAQNVKERELGEGFGKIYPWQGKLKWKEDPRRYGTPTLWFLGARGEVLREPLFGNDYDASPPQIHYGFAEAREIIEGLLAPSGASLAAPGVSSPVAAPRERPADHVVLISIDGLRPEFYLDTRWPAPMIQQMAREGTHARGVRSVFPSVTYPSHTSMVTGALPARHGVYYNVPFEPDGQSGRWYWEFSYIRVPTLWHAVRQAGLKSAAISWPVTVGAPIDWNIPEVWSLDRSADPLEAARKATTPQGFWEELEREATGRLSSSNFTVEHMTRDDLVGRAAAYLLERYRPALLAIHILATDRFQHQAGKEAPVVHRAVAAADRAVSQIYEAAERAGLLDRTAFVITGDHGFIETHTQLLPNVWLVEAGLREARPDRGNWRATFHSAGGSAFLFLREGEDGTSLRKVKDLLAELPAKYRRLFQVVERRELEELGVDPSVPLALSAIEGVRFSGTPTGPVIQAASGATHGFRPDHHQMQTGFIGWGAGFGKGVAADSLALEDVAPIVARLLDLPFEAPDGLVPEGLLEK